MQKNRLLIAAGGTGGHIFPAQALARDLQESGLDVELLFAGGGLNTNTYLQKELFSYQEISAATPFRGSLLTSSLKIAKGIWQSKQLLKRFKPELIIGFGSFHTFPILMAANRVPFILVETNAIPGKVNRLFASKALTTCVQFKECGDHLKGNVDWVDIPVWSKEKNILTKQEARKKIGLGEDLFTILVVGGSQGAESLNEAILKTAPSFPYQVIHICGKNQKADELISEYEKKGVRSYVRNFEPDMSLMHTCADLAFCRAGAGTINELIEQETPSILVPWPRSSDRHQEYNGTMVEKMGGGTLLMENRLDQLDASLESAKQKLDRMRHHLRRYKESNRPKLVDRVRTHLNKL